MIKLKEIVESAMKEGGKLFGARAQRISTADMNYIYNELKKKIGEQFSKFTLSRALPSKADHGDVDIVVVDGPNDLKNMLQDALGNAMVDYSKNGAIHSILYYSDGMDKTVHVDLIRTPADEHDTHYDYLSYNDFSGILGVVARRLHFNYGTKGFFKIYEDKSGRNNYVLLTKNLREGLVILGYKHVLPQFDQIQTLEDVIKFIGSSDLFDSRHLQSFGMNASDRKRTRSERPSAQAIRDGLLKLNKSRKIEDEDYFLKQEFPQYYQKLQTEIEKIENQTIAKSKYGGEWLMSHFPEVKPGPIIGQIKNFWQKTYGDKLDAVPEDELIAKTREFLNK
jgi:hypothetical protein